MKMQIKNNFCKETCNSYSLNNKMWNIFVLTKNPSFFLKPLGWDITRLITANQFQLLQAWQVDCKITETKTSKCKFNWIIGCVGGFVWFAWLMTSVTQFVLNNIDVVECQPIKLTTKKHFAMILFLIYGISDVNIYQDCVLFRLDYF